MNFIDINTTEDLADFLGYTLQNLSYIAYKLKPAQKYTTFYIQKKNGSPRTISAPNNTIKKIQHKIKEGLESAYKTNSMVHGFVKDKNIITNARSHLKQKFVINIDLSDFFPTIHFGRVRGIFINYFKFSDDVSTLLAQLLCFHNALPQGSPCSPIMSNIICGELDKKLANFAKQNKFIYTRYVDDITFSTNIKAKTKTICLYNDGVLELSKGFEELISNCGFIVNKNKIFFNGKNKRQQVTGLVVNEKVNYQKSYINNIRSILHHCEKDLVGTAINYNNIFAKHKRKLPNDKKEIIKWFAQVIKGKLLFAIQVCPKLSLIKYCEQYNKIFKNINYINYEKCESDYELKQKVVRILNKDGIGIGSAFFIKNVGLVTCFHVVKDEIICYYFYNGQNYCFETNAMIFDEKQDIAILKTKNLNGFEIKNNQRYQLDKEVIVIAYPNADVDIFQENGRILCKGTFFGNEVYKTSQRIVWGMSGGVVIDKNNCVYGMCVQGEGPTQMAETDLESGIIPGRFIYDFIQKNLHNSIDNKQCP